eukprot:gnl/TRDRNA2_/TRDRNA2_92731_c0_seq1.p1 gnl/TRDRNA2_/TRDRNA2_92731_c0~~gnl/TRDRNA2_/TRDRNA2_92731_c0_seq1.p1  ORF type:complete len:451 (+),score=49.34 gnl/TRDRNA2_/TRDRNA2_92731_c0_seq1:112-1353(+)
MYEERADRSKISMTGDCARFVTGRNGNTLRTLEDQWGVLMMFAKDINGRGNENEWLVIFGSRRNRRGAELKVMAAVEYKVPGRFLDVDGQLKAGFDQPGDEEDESRWGYDTLILDRADFSYALGAKGSTRVKLAMASKCIIEYIGNTCIFAGSARERKLGRDYLDILLEQRAFNPERDATMRDDCTFLEVEKELAIRLTGIKGEGLRRLEARTDTFIFFDRCRRGLGAGDERLMICSESASNRKQAFQLAQERLREMRRDDRRDRYDSRSRSFSRDRSRDSRHRRSRDRDDSRDRSRYRDDRRDRDRSRSGGRERNDFRGRSGDRGGGRDRDESRPQSDGNQDKSREAETAMSRDPRVTATRINPGSSAAGPALLGIVLTPGTGKVTSVMSSPRGGSLWSWSHHCSCSRTFSL